MDGLHFRKKEKEDDLLAENEYMDEEEQEKLLQELRAQNDTANLHILRGLVVVGLLVAFLFGSVLFQNASRPIIPISYLYGATASVLKAPMLATLCSLSSIALTILALLSSSRAKAMIPRISTIHVGSAAIAIGSISPLMSIIYKSTFVELVFWLIPFLLMTMYCLALRMINQVYQGLDELEGAKYKFKGA